MEPLEEVAKSVVLLRMIMVEAPQYKEKFWMDGTRTFTIQLENIALQQIFNSFVQIKIQITWQMKVIIPSILQSGRIDIFLYNVS